jgi:uncharacterized protein YuzE
MAQKMTDIIQIVRYDRASDVLYIATRPGRPAVSKEGLPGVLWRYDAADGEIVGVTIMDFGYYWASRTSELASDIAAHIPVTSRTAKTILEGVH